jgi:hypothetical protein
MSDLGCWSTGALRTHAAMTSVAAIGLVSAWAGARSSSSLSDQVGWLNLAVAAFALSGLSFGLWLLTARRRLAGRRRQLLSTLPSAQLQAAPTRSGWVHLPGTRRGHRPDCLLVQGKMVQPLSPTQARAAGLEPCETCA